LASGGYRLGGDTGALNAIFGPSRKKVWRRLAAEMGARYVTGGFVRPDRVEAASGGWTITLETYYSGADKRTYTRLRAEYISLDAFRFTVYRRGLFTEVAKSIGMQDVDVGHADFDRDFVVKGNDEAKLRALFSDPDLRRLVTVQPRLHLSVQEPWGFFSRRRLPENTLEMCYTAPGVIKDPARLKGLFQLLAAALARLLAMGSASPAGPCPGCGYDMRGNESGVCPECGTTSPSATTLRGGTPPAE
jgi:hypothetical protein